MNCPVCNCASFWNEETGFAFVCRDCGTEIRCSALNFHKVNLDSAIDKQEWIKAIKAIRNISCSQGGETIGLKEAKTIVDVFRKYIPVD